MSLASPALCALPDSRNPESAGVRMQKPWLRAGWVRTLFLVKTDLFSGPSPTAPWAL